jgi:hypothetical protein
LPKEITRQQLEEKMDAHEDFYLVETLSEEQYNHSHLPGAIPPPPAGLRHRGEG